jgi:hypothetical protein
MTIETRDSRGMLRMPTDAELASCDASERERWSDYITKWNAKATADQAVADLSAELVDRHKRRDAAQAIVLKLSPSGSAEATKHARAWVETQRRVAAGEL